MILIKFTLFQEVKFSKKKKITYKNKLYYKIINNIKKIPQVDFIIYALRNKNLKLSQE